MLPRIGSSKLVSTWILVTLVASIVALLGNGWLAGWVALSPERIWHGEVWRLVTWALVEVGPWGIVFTCASIYKFGGELAPRWGDRRLRRFMLHIVLAGGVASALGALVSEHAWQMFRCGGWAVGDALLIAWARQYPTSTIRLYGFLELGGNRLVGITVGVTVLIAISTSPFYFLPELVACLGAAFYPRGWLSR